MSEETTEILADDTEILEEDQMPEGLEGLEAEYYRDFKFKVIMYEDVLNTDVIIRQGFRLTKDFVDKVVIDEVIFSQMPMREKRRHRMRSHEDLSRVFPDTEEGRKKKIEKQSEIFNRFIQGNCLSSRSSQNDRDLFNDVFEITQKAWKKEEGFSSNDFHRFAKNRATDPDLIRLYKRWFENVFSSAAMLTWEAMRLRENPEILEEEKAPEKAEKKEEKTDVKPHPAISPRLKLGAIGLAGLLLISSVFYFSVKLLLHEEEIAKRSASEEDYRQGITFTHLCGKEWAHNNQNDLLLLAQDKVKTKKYHVVKSEKRIYYPAIQGPFETYIHFKERLAMHKKVLVDCGYKVTFVKGPEATLLEKEKKYLEAEQNCLKS